jgi:hypothetical protein
MPLMYFISVVGFQPNATLLLNKLVKVDAKDDVDVESAQAEGCMHEKDLD